MSDECIMINCFMYAKLTICSLMNDILVERSWAAKASRMQKCNGLGADGECQNASRSLLPEHTTHSSADEQ